MIFEPGLFGEGVQIREVTYHMVSVDAGVKLGGWALEGEFFYRRLDDFHVRGGDVPFDQTDDFGIQAWASAMVKPKKLQVYLGGAKIFGEFGDPWDVRVGLNYFPFETKAVRWNNEVIYLNESPVGGIAYPYAVGGTGSCSSRTSRSRSDGSAGRPEAGRPCAVLRSLIVRAALAAALGGGLSAPAWSEPSEPASRASRKTRGSTSAGTRGRATTSGFATSGSGPTSMRAHGSARPSTSTEATSTATSPARVGKARCAERASTRAVGSRASSEPSTRSRSRPKATASS